MKKYVVTLTAEERQSLSDLIAAGEAAASGGGLAWPDLRISEAAEVSVATIERVRQRFVEPGLEAALVRKTQARPSRQRALDGRAEARLIALACSVPPDGRKSWTMRLLAGKLVELEVVPTISDETVRRSLTGRLSLYSGFRRPSRRG
jgi:hypothetical protein